MREQACRAVLSQVPEVQVVIESQLPADIDDRRENQDCQTFTSDESPRSVPPCEADSLCGGPSVCLMAIFSTPVGPFDQFVRAVSKRASSIESEVGNFRVDLPKYCSGEVYDIRIELLS